VTLPLPPRWARRVLVAPLLWFVSVWLLVAVIPVLLILLAVLSFTLPWRLRVLRLTGFALVWMVIEVVGLPLAFLTWIASGFGYAMHRPTFVDLHYRILKASLGTLFWFGCRYFQLTVDVEGPYLPGDDGDPTTREFPLLVMSRHAGPGDSFLLVHELLSWAGRRPRIVLKDTLQLDPFIDIYLNRLPMSFVDPTSARQGESLRQIARLASTMEARDALLIFPEGGNVTPGRRARAIEKLRTSGRQEAAARAEGIEHLMPPRPGGVRAALVANPDLQVVVVAHTGLDHLDSLKDIWHEIPLRKTLHIKWHVVPSAQVPTDMDGLSDWLFTEWELMDLWVDEHQALNGDGGSARAPGGQ
jgi:1-acyl-sn-glycerol-3-phosphate acyltransferase